MSLTHFNSQPRRQDGYEVGCSLFHHVAVLLAQSCRAEFESRRTVREKAKEEEEKRPSS